MSEPPPEGAPPEGPPPEHDGVAAVEEPSRCWRCSSPHDRYQEYCLECGARLVPLAAGGTLWRRETWTRDSPVWFWATFLGLLLVALVAGAIVLAATRDDGPDDGRRGAQPPQSVSTLTSIPTLPPTTDVTTNTLPDTVTIEPPVQTLPPPATPTPGPAPTPAPTPSPSPSPTPPPAAGGTVRSWPSGRDGYTIILTSIPHGQGRAAAEQRAREAIGKGVRDVGVLDSSQYSSLTAGYYVVFAGVHDTEAQALAQLASVRQAGYPVAYLREIAP